MHVGTSFSAKEVEDILRAEGLEPKTYDFINTKFARFYALDVEGERYAEREDWNPDIPEFRPKTNERFDVA